MPQSGQRVLERGNAHDWNVACATASIRNLRGRDDHERDMIGARRNRLLLDPADRSDRAVRLDGPGDRNLLAAGEVTGREIVDDREREREPGRRSTHSLRVDAHIDRELVADQVERSDTETRGARGLVTGGHTLRAADRDASSRD